MPRRFAGCVLGRASVARSHDTRRSQTKKKQNEYYATGRSKVKYPNGKHNAMPSMAVTGESAMNIFLKIAKAVAMWYVRKHAIELVTDATIAGMESLAKRTDTKIDDAAVQRVKEDKAELMKVIKEFI